MVYAKSQNVYSPQAMTAMTVTMSEKVEKE